MMSKKWLSRILVGGALVAGSSLIAASPAHAQTESPDGFGPCVETGLPSDGDFREFKLARGNDRVDEWSGMVGTYGPPPGFNPFGPREVHYTDRIVIDDRHNRYIHLRNISGENDVEVIGCKNKKSDETPADAPRLRGSGNPIGSVNPSNGGSYIVFWQSTPVRTGTVTVGEPEPVKDDQSEG